MAGAKPEAKDQTGAEWAATGVCKWFNVLKGWGFISPEEPDERGDVFVHQIRKSCIKKLQSVVKMEGFRSLGEGERVKFTAKPTKKGYEATEVTGPDGAACNGSNIRPLGNNRTRRQRCFNCGQFAQHVAKKCPLEPQPKACYRCKDPGHLIGNCPERPAEGEPKSPSRQKKDSGPKTESPAKETDHSSNEDKENSQGSSPSAVESAGSGSTTKAAAVTESSGLGSSASSEN